MQSLYDVLGSMMIGGIILLMLLQFNATVMEGAAAQTFTSIVQSNLTAMADMVEYDFRKIGYLATGVTDTAVVYADSNKITFKGDIDNNGVVDVVTYAFDRNKASGHPRIRGRILYRTADRRRRTSTSASHASNFVYYDKITFSSPPIRCRLHRRSDRSGCRWTSRVPPPTIPPIRVRRGLG